MRDPTTWQTYAFGATPTSTDITDKGYTGQQQLDALGLIHMNGRVQDPYSGRFVSADPTVPDPFFSQAFNRYAYVYNNPMNSVDPSGFDPNANPDANGYFREPNGDGYYPDETCPQGCLHITIYGGTSLPPPAGTPVGAIPSDSGTDAVNAGGSGGGNNGTPTGTTKGTGSSQIVTTPGPHCASNSCTSNGIASSGYGSTSTVPGSGNMCWNGQCGNGVEGNMDSTDGATTWNGMFSNNDASQPIGFLGAIPQPPKQVNTIALPGRTGGGVTKAAPLSACTGSLGCRSNIPHVSVHVIPGTYVDDRGGGPVCPECYVLAALKVVGTVSSVVSSIRPVVSATPWKVVFGHGARHLEGTGLSQERVEAIIDEAVSGLGPNDVSGYFQGRVQIDGTVIQYNGYPLSNQTLNIGTYYPVSPPTP